jgi:hypothetical protein
MQSGSPGPICPSLKMQVLDTGAGLLRPSKGEPARGSAKTADAPGCAAASITAAAAPRNATAAPQAQAQQAQAHTHTGAAATTATAASAATATTSDANADVATAAEAATATTSTATATTMASTATAAARDLREAGGAVFPVEEVECRKTNVSHFLFAKNEALIGCDIRRLRNVGGRKSGC